MKYIQGKDRTQTAIFPVTMEQAINQDHEVRIIDLFVDSPGVEKMGFSVDFGENGRPAYHPKDRLKPYIIGIEVLRKHSLLVFMIKRAFLGY